MPYGSGPMRFRDGSCRFYGYGPGYGAGYGRGMGYGRGFGPGIRIWLLRTIRLRRRDFSGNGTSRFKRVSSFPKEGTRHDQ